MLEGLRHSRALESRYEGCTAREEMGSRRPLFRRRSRDGSHSSRLHSKSMPVTWVLQQGLSSWGCIITLGTC